MLIPLPYCHTLNWKICPVISITRHTLWTACSLCKAILVAGQVSLLMVWMIGSSAHRSAHAFPAFSTHFDGLFILERVLVMILTQISYDQLKMRVHLVQCLQRKQFREFPRKLSGTVPRVRAAVNLRKVKVSLKILCHVVYNWQQTSIPCHEVSVFICAQNIMYGHTGIAIRHNNTNTHFTPCIYFSSPHWYNSPVHHDFAFTWHCSMSKLSCELY